MKQSGLVVTEYPEVNPTSPHGYHPKIHAPDPKLPNPTYEKSILLPPFNTIRGTPKAATERLAAETTSLTEMVTSSSSL
jgi:hypothetical protein